MFKVFLTIMLLGATVHAVAENKDGINGHTNEMLLVQKAITHFIKICGPRSGCRVEVDPENLLFITEYQIIHEPKVIINGNKGDLYVMVRFVSDETMVVTGYLMSNVRYAEKGLLERIYGYIKNNNKMFLGEDGHIYAIMTLHSQEVTIGGDIDGVATVYGEFRSKDVCDAIYCKHLPPPPDYLIYSWVASK